jgi:hypothetical protein
VAFAVQQELAGMSEMLARYGDIAGVDTKASVSVAVGVGIVTAVVGKEATFVVTAVGYGGTPRTEGGDVVEVMFGPAPVEGSGGGAAAAVEEPPSKRRRKKTKAASSQPKGTAAPAPAAPTVGTVVDGENGTYQCSYIPWVDAAAGMWQLAVQIGGLHIAGSPFAVELVAGKEFVFEQITQGGYMTAASFDGKGVLHWIGTKYGTMPYTNPHKMGAGGVVATRSSGAFGSPKWFVIHDHDGTTSNYTANTPNSCNWMAVDLGPGRRLVPTHYCLRHGIRFGGYRLLHWRFEGSNDGATWTVLKDHTYDASPFPDHGYSVAAWPVNPPPPAGAGAGAAGSPGFRYFRIIQTGKNTDFRSLMMNMNRSLVCAGIELYGLFTEEE